VRPSSRRRCDGVLRRKTLKGFGTPLQCFSPQDGHIQASAPRVALGSGSNLSLFRVQLERSTHGHELCNAQRSRWLQARFGC